MLRFSSLLFVALIIFAACSNMSVATPTRQATATLAPEPTNTQDPLPTPRPSIPAPTTNSNASCAVNAADYLAHLDSLFDRWSEAYSNGIRASDPSPYIREISIIQQDIGYMEGVRCATAARDAFHQLNEYSIRTLKAIKQGRSQELVLDEWKEEARWLEKYTKTRQLIGPWSP